jgi:low affinity Fe/Cu permease
MAKIANRQRSSVSDFFHRFAAKVAALTGSAGSFLMAVAVIAVWGTTGPFFHFSDTWQLVINTGTTIVTFLMVFLIQNTQNRDSQTVNMKLDELLRSLKGARNRLVQLETLSDAELEELRSEFHELHEQECRKRAAQLSYAASSS